MILIRSEDLLHKSRMNRLLIEIIDQPILSQELALKGGTCAAMLRYLDRFSVDLDFDVLEGADETRLRQEFLKVFADLDFTITKEFESTLFFQLRYPSEPGKRNTLKLSASSPIVKANQYKVQYLGEIDRLMRCQTVETMFANKLVAVTDRYQVHGTLAGRDVYDIHYFFTHGYNYHAPIIDERTGLDPEAYLRKLSDFIRKNFTQTVVNEDLNTLMPARQFQQVRKILIPETLYWLEREIGRLENKE